MQQIISFNVHNKTFGLFILEIQEIIRMKKLTPLPNVPEYVRGVLNLRGNIIPVIDMRLRLNFSKAEYTDFTRVIVATAEKKTVGLIIDKINSVITVDDAKIKTNFTAYKGVSQELLNGIVEDNKSLILILSLKKLILNI